MITLSIRHGNQFHDPESLQLDYNRTFDAWASSDDFICPHCGCRLWRHSKIARSFVMADGSAITLIIHRVYCPCCHKSHRCLPDFILPGYQIDTHTAFAVAKDHSAGRSSSSFRMFPGWERPQVKNFIRHLLKFPGRKGLFLLHPFPESIPERIVQVFSILDLFGRLIFHFPTVHF